MNYKNKILAFVVPTFFSCFFILLFFVTAHAASLSVSPASTRVSVGNIVSVKVVVGTEGKSINNVDTVILFPVDLLEVVSIGKTSSIFPLWVEEPHFSNIDGRVVLNGGVPNPGFTGSTGEVVTIKFKAKKQGTASIVFSDSAVRENNGLGTDILTSKLIGTVQIDPTQQLEVPVTAVGVLPVKPTIKSSSHPDSGSWYSNSSASFSWVVPNGVIALQTLLGKNAESIPTILYDNSVSQRTVSNLSDGVHYFHLRYQNGSGWGQTAHQKIQVDTTPPENFSTYVKRVGVMDVVVLDAFDKLSGIDYYEIKVDDRAKFVVDTDSVVGGGYTLPVENRGDHTVFVTAYDMAGNSAQSATTYTSGEILAPTFHTNPNQVGVNENFVVRGSSFYPLTDVVVSIEFGNKGVETYATQTLEDGSFSLSASGFDRSGVAKVWVQFALQDGVVSPISEIVTMTVNDSPFVETTKLIIFALTALILILILIIGLLIVAYLGWHKFAGLEEKISRDLKVTAGGIHESLSTFKIELNKQLAVIERARIDRELNQKEEEVFRQLRKNIDNIDEFIEKKLKKITKS